MKKLLFLILTVLIGCLDSYADAEFTFEFDSYSRTCTLTKAENATGDVIIPSKVEKDGIEYDVTEINGGRKGGYVFEKCTLTSLTIPECITSISQLKTSSSIQTLYYNATSARYYYNSGGSLDNVIVGKNVRNVPLRNVERLEFWQGVDSIAEVGNETIIHLTDIDDWAVNPPSGFNPMYIRQLYEYIGNREHIERMTLYYPSIGLKKIRADYNGQPIKNLTLGSKVTGIAPYAFAGFSDIQSVTLSDYLTEIGESAFSGTSMTSVSLPESVRKVGDYSFACCKDLVNVSLPTSLDLLGKGTFAHCSALYSVGLPANLGKISDWCFFDCSDLEEIKLPETITAIGDLAFMNCSKLKIPVFPTNLETIGEQAFMNNSFSGEMKFGDKLRVIGTAAFICKAYSSELSIHFTEGLDTIKPYAFARIHIKEINLPQSLRMLGDGAFYGTSLSTITIPDGITKIHDSTFESSNLNSIILPNRLEEIGNYAFKYSELTEIKLPESLKAIGREAFNLGVGLPNVTIPDGVTSIGTDAFSSVRYLTLGAELASLPDPIAKNVDVLEMKSATPPALGTDRLGFTPKIVIVPEGAETDYTSSVRWKDYNISARNSRRATVYVTEPGTLAVECRVQTGFLPGQVTNLIVEGTLNDDDFAVMRSNMTACYSIDLSGVSNTEIPSGAFSGKETLLEMALPGNTTKIGDRAFADCYVMNLRNIPANLDSIQAEAFSSCMNLNLPMEFPASMKYIGEKAFYYCRSIVSVDFSECPAIGFYDNGSGYLYDDVFDDWYMDKGIFSKCINLSSVILPDDLISIPFGMFSGTGLKSLILPSSVTDIKQYAFADTHSLREVVFPESLKEIQEKAFYRSGIEYADLPLSLTSLKEDAFRNSSLVYVDIKEQLESLSNWVFAGCKDLMVANLPSSLKSIGENALATSSLSAITSASLVPPATDKSPFTGVDNYSCALTIPKPSYSKYLSAEYWGAFVNIRNWIDITIPENPNSDSDSDEEAEIEVTYIDEDDYQAMLEEETSQTPPQEAKDNNRRSKALRVLQRNGVIGRSHGYGRLFNGASLFAADKSRTRIFLNIPVSFDNLKVLYNGKDVTSQIDYETMSFVTPELTTVSSFEIKGNYPISGIEEIGIDKSVEPIYTLTGVKVGSGEKDFSRLPAGIYIFDGRKILIK